MTAFTFGVVTLDYLPICLFHMNIKRLIIIACPQIIHRKPFISR